MSGKHRGGCALTGGLLNCTDASMAPGAGVTFQADQTDTDMDGMTNLEEFEQRTDPTSVDTDGDGVMDHDLIISGGHVIDGTGADAVRADIGIKDGRYFHIAFKTALIFPILGEPSLFK